MDDTLGALFEVLDVRDEVSFQLRNRYLGALRGVQEALARLRTIDSAAAIKRRATVELCHTCGFDRAMLWRIEGSKLVPESVCVPGDPEFEARVMAFGREQPPRLDHRMIETEMLRRRTPALIEDARSHPGSHKPFIEFVDAISYVAAPVMPQGRVIGFLHADLRRTARSPDLIDRDILYTFAEGFGYAIERSILREQLRVQRDHVRSLLATTDRVLASLCETELQLAPVSRNGGTPIRSPATTPIDGTRLDGLLTRRELEVIALMAEGATNGAIAERLVIGTGTVKCHVRSILRKLRAGNRGEAVHRYLKLAQPGH